MKTQATWLELGDPSTQSVHTMGGFNEERGTVDISATMATLSSK